MSEQADITNKAQDQGIAHISERVKKEIRHWLKKYPADQKRSAVLIALRLVQEDHDNWLTLPHLNAVAEFLELPRIAVYEVATFYKMYNLKPVGRHRIAVCNNISCMLNGSEKVIKHIEERLGIKQGETTEDGCFTLKETECLAACVKAPVLQVNDKDYYENLSFDEIDTLLEKLKHSEANHGE